MGFYKNYLGEKKEKSNKKEENKEEKTEKKEETKPKVNSVAQLREEKQ